MDRLRIRRRLAASSLAPVVALPSRLAMVATHDFRVAAASIRWLFLSREHTNLTYELTTLNREHLAWFVASVTGAPVGDIRRYMAELQDDDQLRTHVRVRTSEAARKGIADPDARYARRLGWYAFVRATKPAHVVETGTDKGLGSCVLGAALLRNGGGRLTTIDYNPESGYLIAPPYDTVIDRVIGDSLHTLQGLEAPIDMFLHDSDHSLAYESAEFDAAKGSLATGALVLSDNAHATNALARWAEATGRTFLFFDERPAAHWYSGDGIGVAFSR